MNRKTLWVAMIISMLLGIGVANLPCFGQCYSPCQPSYRAMSSSYRCSPAYSMPTRPSGHWGYGVVYGPRCYSPRPQYASAPVTHVVHRPVVSQQAPAARPSSKPATVPSLVPATSPARSTPEPRTPQPHKQPPANYRPSPEFVAPEPRVVYRK